MNKEICLIVFAPIYGPSGYAKLSRDMVLGLDKLGVKIKLEPNRLWEPNETVLKPHEEKRLNELERTVFPKGIKPAKLSIGIAPWFDKEYTGYKIGYTMFEFDNLPNIGKYDWVKDCNAMDEVWVPSNYNYKSFTDNGVKNVFVMSPGIDTNDFNINKEPLIDRRDGKFRFVAVGEYINRKGWDLLIPAYLAEFDRNDNVTLIIKSYCGSKKLDDSKQKIKEDIIKYRAESPNPLYPNILFIGDILSNNRLPNLYTSSDCFVLASRGEGFGLPIAEAMSCGIPCILPNNSAYLDFVNNNNGWLVNINGFESCSLLGEQSVLYKDSHSPKIDVNHLRKLMRYAYNNREEVKEKGMIAKDTIANNFTIEKSINTMYNRLKDLGLYVNKNVVNIVTNNLEELVLDRYDIVQKSEDQILNINLRNNTKLFNIAMLIPTWGENCGIADYTKRLVYKLKEDNNVTVVKNIFDLVSIVKKQEIKTVHIQHHYSFYNSNKIVETIKSLHQIGCKVVMTVHDYTGTSDKNDSFKYCDNVIVHSNFIKNKMVSDNVVDKKNVDVIFIGCDKVYTPNAQDSNEEFLFLKNKFVVSSFGFLHPHKNWDKIVGAISTLKKEIPNILYLLLSVNKNESDYSKLIDSKIIKLGINDYVKRFSNYLPENRVLRILSNSDVVVLPYSNYKLSGSEYYGSSISGRFAIRTQKPLIVSNASFFHDLENVSYSIKEPTIENIVKGIKEIYYSNDLRKNIVSNQNNFSLINSWDNFKEKVLEIYLKVNQGA